MPPFEVLYGHRCHTALNWIKPGGKVIFGPDLVEEIKTTIHHAKRLMQTRGVDLWGLK
jgi:hypothetical protein